jgi:hypothetical protein
MKRQRRVKYSVEVGSGTARCRAGIQTQNIGKALRLVGSGHPRGVVEVAFPKEPEAFFVRRPSTSAGAFGHEQLHEVAA